MKGIQGLIIAIVLGILGALCNWAYLAGRASQEETVAFVGVRDGRTVNRGETLRDDDLVAIKIPARLAGNLKNLAVLFDAKQSVVGQPVWRTMTGECLLMNDDIKTPPSELKLEEGETVMWIPVDTRAFVPSLVRPGDMVSFKVGRPSGPTPAGRGDGLKPIASSSSGPDEPIGPFKILALGNRLGSPEVMRAAKMPQLQENVLAIRVSSHVPGEKERANTLFELLQATNFRQVGVVLHNRKSDN